MGNVKVRVNNDDENALRGRDSISDKTHVKT